jgi:hypothetical protein
VLRAHKFLKLPIHSLETSSTNRRCLQTSTEMSSIGNHDRHIQISQLFKNLAGLSRITLLSLQNFWPSMYRHQRIWYHMFMCKKDVGLPYYIGCRCTGSQDKCSPARLLTQLDDLSSNGSERWRDLIMKIEHYIKLMILMNYVCQNWAALPWTILFSHHYACSEL